ncbi:HofO family protein [Vagococcus sp. WN89Y]|uniref:HofO family protein n=1 Tax=Vagococcus sp. WN89Y TaxID=3457258 RepID=UPI003FCE89E0
MGCNLDRWLALSVTARLLCWLAATLCGLALLWWLLISPQQKQLAQLARERTAREASRQVLWRTLRALEPPAGAPLPAFAHTCLFSPLSLPSQEQQLVRWQPERDGAEAELETGWEAAVNVFQRLAQCDMHIPAFSLAGTGNTLRFIMQLEQGDSD